MSSSKPTFIPATFGNGSNSVSVQLLKFPPTDAPLLDKVQAFAYFDEVIQQFRSQLSSATFQQAYATTIPVSSSAAASEDSNRISQLLHAAYFSVNNVACLGFYTANRKSVRIDLDPCDRMASIRFVKFEATVDPVVISPDLKSASPITVTYFFAFAPDHCPCCCHAFHCHRTGRFPHRLQRSCPFHCYGADTQRLSLRHDRSQTRLDRPFHCDRPLYARHASISHQQRPLNGYPPQTVYSALGILRRHYYCLP
jgi:hypothetical protein